MTFASILIPTFNQAEYLVEALQSVADQTDGDWEAIIVNDGSTDHTETVAQQFSQKDPRFRYIRQENGGVAAALNTGLAHARGQWIHWLSSDDLFEPEKLAINRKWIADHPHSEFFFSRFSLLREATGELERKQDLWGPVPHKDHQILTLFYRNYVSGISICVRRGLWERVGNFDQRLRYGQDYDQWLRMLEKTRAVFIPEWTVISRNHAAQGSETFPAACYYDTARAAIRFLNETPFERLVPQVDLADLTRASAAVRAALDVAARPDAFIYALGAHPLLAGRVLEWVFSPACPFDDIRRETRQQVETTALQRGSQEWEWMWRSMAAAVQGSDPRVSVTQLDLREHAIRRWHQLSFDGNSEADDVARYIRRFIDPDATEPSKGLPLPLNVTVLRPEGRAPDCSNAIARTIVGTGGRVGLFHRVEQGQSARLSQGFCEIAWIGDAQDVLPWAGDADLCLAEADDDAANWTPARRVERMSHENLARIVKDPTVLRQHAEAAGEPRPVIFLTRVLQGGGAERVVQDIVNHLDPRRFAPQIWTLFPEHLDRPAETSVPTRSLVPTPDGRGKMRRLARRGLNAAHNRYLRFVSPAWRAKPAVRTFETMARFVLRVLRSLSYRIPHLARRIRDALRGPAGDGSVSEANQAAIVQAHHAALLDRLKAATPDIPEKAVIVAIMEEATIAAAGLRENRDLPVLASLHTVQSVVYRDTFDDEARVEAEEAVLRTALNAVDLVLTPGAGCQRDLVTHFEIPADHVKVLPNPVDCARLRRKALAPDAAAEIWSRTNARILRLVHVGRFDPQKDHALLLEACAALRKKGIAFSLALVGGGWYGPSIQAQVSALGLNDQVTYAGELENPLPWIIRANALVLTSRFEAFGLVLVEAMICGTPAIALDCPFGPREVLEDGKYGVLVPQRSGAALADAILQVYSKPDLVKRLSQAGYQRAADFDVRRIVKDWETLLGNQEGKTAL